MQSGIVDQVIYFVALDATDLKTRETGLSSFTVYRSRNGGAATAFTTPTVTEVSSANMPGVYQLLLDEDMTIDSGDDSQEMAFHITHAGMAPVTRTIELYRPIVTAGRTLSVESDGMGHADLKEILGAAAQAASGIFSVNVTQWLEDSVATGTVPGVPAVNCMYWQDSPLAVPAVAGIPKVAITHWVATAVAPPTVNGVPEVDVTHWVGGVVPAVTVTGVPEVDVTHWIGAVCAPVTAAGVPEVDVTHWAGSTSGTPNVNVIQVLGETATALQTGRIFHVSASGGSSSNPGTRTLPLDTFANAQTAARFGDTIVLLAGTYGAIAITKDGIHVRGEGDATHITSGLADTINMQNTKHVTISRLKATQTSSLVTLEALGSEWCSFYDLNLIGGEESFDVFGIQTTKHAYASGVRAVGQGFDTTTIAGAENFLIEHCWFEHNGVSNLSGGTSHSALLAISAYGQVRNTDLRIARSHAAGENGRDVYGISLGTAFVGKHSTVLLENVRINASSAYTGSGGKVFGIATLQPGANPQGTYRLTMVGGHIITSNAGSGGAWDVRGDDDLNLPVGERTATGKLHGVNRIGTVAGSIEVLDANVSETKTRALLALPPWAPSVPTGLPTTGDLIAGGGLDAAGVRSAIGLATANLDTQLGAVATVDDLASMEVVLTPEALQGIRDSMLLAPTDDPATGSVDDLIVTSGGGGGGSNIGPGADLITLRFTIDGTIAIADADVWITSDSAGATVIAGTRQTNSIGEVTFMLTEGLTYYAWLQKDGVESIEGRAFVADA